MGRHEDNVGLRHMLDHSREANMWIRVTAERELPKYRSTRDFEFAFELSEGQNPPRGDEAGEKKAVNVSISDTCYVQWLNKRPELADTDNKVGEVAKWYAVEKGLKENQANVRIDTHNSPNIESRALKASIPSNKWIDLSRGDDESPPRRIGFLV